MCDDLSYRLMLPLTACAVYDLYYVYREKHNANKKRTKRHKNDRSFRFGTDAISVIPRIHYVNRYPPSALIDEVISILMTI